MLKLHFNNDGTSIKKFTAYIKRAYGEDVRAICESINNYWIKLHDMLEDYGINTILAPILQKKITPIWNVYAQVRVILAKV